jgi:hypothetical protein
METLMLIKVMKASIASDNAVERPHDVLFLVDLQSRLPVPNTDLEAAVRYVKCLKRL